MPHLGHRQRLKSFPDPQLEKGGIPNLHHDFEPVQRPRAGPGNGSGSSTGDQVSPPHTGLLLLYGKVIRYHQVLTHVDYLSDRDMIET